MQSPGSGNIVRGNAGNSVIAGGDGNDCLTGLGGQDRFLFNTALNAATNVDVVTDFNVADDTILLDQDIFSSGLGLGNMRRIGSAGRSMRTTASSTTSTPARSPTTSTAPWKRCGPVRHAEPRAGAHYLDFLVV